ncbi:MAG: hypothetical protein K6A32_03400 [Bacteroidales bacterium]|nr:hypothetical protein [Bacteroidales bacterium]
MKLRLILTALCGRMASWCLLLLCTFTAFAQDVPNAMVLHQTDGKAIQMGIADIDCITFTGAVAEAMPASGVPVAVEPGVSMLIYQKSSAAPLSYLLDNIEWIDFASVPATELYEAVDLGLSVCWAAFNIGASSPEEYGDFFAWGETKAKSRYTESSYSYYKKGQYEYIGVNICGTKYDAARQAWGGLWRLPARSEVAELTSQCTWTAETLNGVSGYRVTGPNGNSIFLPAAGYQNGTGRKEVGTGGFYWSGNLDRSMTSTAYNLNFRGYSDDWSANRFYGFSVRAVR